MAHRRGRRGVGMLAVALAVAVTGCGSGDPGGDPDQSPTVAAGETGPGQTGEPEESAVVDPGIPVPEGSGCEPGPGDLPDGQWYGTVEDLTAQELELGLACWFIGEDAVMAAEEDGAESPPPNDYYVRGADDEERTVAVSPDATVVMYPTGTPEQQTGTVADLIDVAESRGGFPFGVWVEVVDGSVVDLQEQWVP